MQFKAADTQNVLAVAKLSMWKHFLLKTTNSAIGQQLATIKKLAPALSADTVKPVMPKIKAVAQILPAVAQILPVVELTPLAVETKAEMKKETRSIKNLLHPSTLL